MIRASNCCTARGGRGDGGGRSGGVVNETKGNILHKAQAPLPPRSSLDIHVPASVAMGRQSWSCQPRPSVPHIHADIICGLENGTLGEVWRGVCTRVCVRVCVRLCKGDHSILHGHCGIHYHLNDACAEVSICWLTVAWEVPSLCCSSIPS